MTATTDDDYEDLTGYSAARREHSNRPPGFRMYGETFIGEQVLRSAPLLDLPDAVAKHFVHGLLGFLREQLTQDSWERFEVMFRDRTRPVDDLMLDAAVQQLLKQYTARPTQESSSSSATRSKRGRTSKAGSSSKAPALRSA